MLFSQHGAGHLVNWDQVRKVSDPQGRTTLHPLVYVALGSHANYSRPEVIRSASLYPRGPLQRFIYWVDGLIHFIFLLLNPSQQARQIALNEIVSRPGELLNEDAFSSLRDEADHYLVSLPMEIASGDGFRAGYQGDPRREGVVLSSSYLKRSLSDRIRDPPGLLGVARSIAAPRAGVDPIQGPVGSEKPAGEGIGAAGAQVEPRRQGSAAAGARTLGFPAGLAQTAGDRQRKS